MHKDYNVQGVNKALRSTKSVLNPQNTTLIDRKACPKCAHLIALYLAPFLADEPMVPYNDVLEYFFKVRFLQNISHSNSVDPL